MAQIAPIYQTPTKNQQHNYYVNPDQSILSRNRNQFPFDIQRVEVSEYIPYKRIASVQKEEAKPKREKSTAKKLSIVSRFKTEKTEKKYYLKVMSQYKSMSKNIQSQYQESQIANEENYEDSEYKINTLDSRFRHFTQEAQVHQQIPKKQSILQQFIKVEDSSKDSLKIKKKIILTNKKNKLSSKTQLISQTYRYCIGCLHPVLEANIKIHQISCLQFQKIFNLNEQQLVYFVQDLIKHLSVKLKKCQQQLSYQDVQKLNLYTNDLLQQTEQITSSGRYSSYYANCLEEIKAINKKWHSYAEQICKINWFITLQQRIKSNSFKK